MKKRNLLTTLVLALASVGFTASSAKALTYSSDDLMLGFYATGGTGVSSGLVVNIGQASTYRDFTGSFFQLSIGDIGADLVDVFGANWNTRSDVKWGVFGGTFNVAVGSDPVNTLYATKKQSTVGVQATAYNRAVTAPQSAVATKFKDQGQAYAQGTATANSTVATIQDDAINNDFAGFQPGNNGVTSSYSYFGNAILGDFANGTDGTRSDLFRMQTGSGAGSYIGTFSINDAGVVNFGDSANFAPVPEPSTYGIAMGLAAVVFIVIRRRRQIANA